MKKILFLLGSANMSGGTYVILQHALYLQSIGYQVTIGLVFMSQEEFIGLKNSNKCWHDAIKNLEFISIHEASQLHYDVAIFTWWATLFYLEKIHANSFVYFVQSIESRFYPEEDYFMRDLADRSYKIGLPVITEATWIRNYLTRNYKTPSLLVKNGILKSLYTTEGETYAKKPTQGLRILVEGPLDAPYKNVARTIELCQQANVGEIWLLTSSSIQEYPGVSRVFSQVPIYDVPKIYRSCDLLVKLSYVEGMFGPPLEIFHCGGTAIVYDVTGHDEYIIHGHNALVAKTNDELTVIKYLQELSQNRELLQQLQHGALVTAQHWIDWQQSSTEFAQALEYHASQTLSDSQKSTIQTNAHNYLKEHIHTIISIGDQSEQQQIVANPTYDSGFYALTLPIINGLKKHEVQLGKSYQSIRLTSLKLLRINRLTNEIILENLNSIINITVDQMVDTRNGGIFNCLSESSAMIFVINHTTLNHYDYQYCLQLEFRPLRCQSQNKETHSLFITH